MVGKSRWFNEWNKRLTYTESFNGIKIVLSIIGDIKKIERNKLKKWWSWYVEDECISSRKSSILEKKMIHDLFTMFYHYYYSSLFFFWFSSL